jgi:DNA-directed RNA polymerase alpha subunit
MPFPFDASEFNPVNDMYALELSARIAGILHEAGIRSIADLVRYAPGDLLAIRGCGSKTLDDIRAALERHGRHLRHDSPAERKVRQDCSLYAPPTVDEQVAAEPIIKTTDYQTLMGTPVWHLELEPRVQRVLISGGIQTIGELIQRTLTDLPSLRGCGPEARLRIRLALGAVGLSLSDDPQADYFIAGHGGPPISISRNEIYEQRRRARAAAQSQGLDKAPDAAA